MLGELPEAPSNLFDSGVVSRDPVAVDIDITGINDLWLVTEDTDSYDPARTIAGWARSLVYGSGGNHFLTSPKSRAAIQGSRIRAGFPDPCFFRTEFSHRGQRLYPVSCHSRCGPEVSD